MDRLCELSKGTTILAYLDRSEQRKKLAPLYAAPYSAPHSVLRLTESSMNEVGSTPFELEAKRRRTVCPRKALRS